MTTEFFDMFKIITLKQQKFSQSDPVLIRQISKKLQSDPVLIRQKLASVLIRAHLCQVHSTITHTVARQGHTERRQRTMFIHDVWITHESARLLAGKPQYACMEQDSGCYIVPLLIHYSLSCQLQRSILCNIIHVRLNVFWRNGFACHRPGVHNLGYMYHQGYICLSEGVHLRLAIGGKIYLYIIYFQMLIHITLRHKKESTFIILKI